jgi:hypothetical protein
MTAVPGTRELAAIERIVGTYLDGLHDGDTRKISRAFHEVSHLYPAGPDGVVDRPRAKWLEMIAGRPSAKSQGLPRSDRIVATDMSGPETAFVKVECAIPPRHFTDDLLLLKAGAAWRSVAKSIRTEVREGKANG